MVSKENINKQNRNRPVDMKNRLGVVRERSIIGMGEKVKGLRATYRLVVTK